MNRNAAPISQRAWEEINSTARESLINFLSARKVLKVKGPYGKDKGGINEGRLESFVDRGGVYMGNYKLKPFTETRVEFELNRWELDNIERGAEDIELDALEEACEKIARFEDALVYNGLEEAGVEGLKDVCEYEITEFGENARDIRRNISIAVSRLKENYAHPPFDLVVSQEVLATIQSVESPYPLFNAIEEIIGGKIILSRSIKGAVLLPRDDEDIQLVLGEDFTIDYQDSDNEKVKLYITESFTTRILDGAKYYIFKF